MHIYFCHIITVSSTHVHLCDININTHFEFYTGTGRLEMDEEMDYMKTYMYS